MESKWQKVFVACALGAFIGGVVALQLNGYFWWIGLVAGGLVGYFTYEFRTVLKAIPKAWRAVIEWRPNVEYWRAFGKLSVHLTIAASTFTVLPAILFLVSDNYVMSIVLISITLLAGVIVTVIALFDSSITDITEDYQPVIEDARDIARYNVITVYFRYAPKAIWWTIKRIPSIAVSLARFVRKVFRLIHSDERLLCGVDAAIGATVGYFTGNALIGALFGGALGVASFELISKRLLHLIPAKHA